MNNLCLLLKYHTDSLVLILYLRLTQITPWLLSEAGRSLSQALSFITFTERAVKVEGYTW